MKPARSMDVPSAAAAPCPGCSGVGRLVPILYGFHTPEEEGRARSGEAVLGTYSGGPDAPRWECLTCGARLR